MRRSIESDMTERLNKGWDLVGPGDMSTKGSDVVTPSHTAGRSSGRGGPRGTGSSRGPREADPLETHRTPGSATQNTVPTPYAGGTQPREQTGGRGGHRQELIQGNGVSEGSGVRPDGGGSTLHGLHPAGREELRLQSPRCQTQGAGG